MYIVTGALGFIGRHIVNFLGQENVYSFDKQNTVDEIYSLRNVDGIFHQGACADTMCTSTECMKANNVTLSKALIDFAADHGIPIVYASSAAVYGTSTDFREVPANENPINIYAEAKLIVDEYARSKIPAASSAIVGLRYFNVHGPDERSKGRMASMPYQLSVQRQETGSMKIFENGEQSRDFVCVDDVVAVNVFFIKHSFSGILNVGTGNARSFNDLTRMLGGQTEYIPFDANLKGKYQNFTQAEISNLRKAGYTAEFIPLETGIDIYFNRDRLRKT